MNEQSFIKILIAEDNDVSRNMMISVLKTQGYDCAGADDGNAAIDLLAGQDFNMALVDINMAPKGGFEFVKHLVAKGIKLPVVIVTADDSSDVLMQASALGVRKVIQKPIQPDRLIKTVQQVLKRQGINPSPIAVGAYDTKFSNEDIMAQVIKMAQDNARSGNGRPFAAIVTDQEGQILGKGVNGKASRVDPTAHAEVMAIRQASERLGKTDLSDCRLYCISEPTQMGKALITSVGIPKVYYGLTHQDIQKNNAESTPVHAEYVQFSKAEALNLFED